MSTTRTPQGQSWLIHLMQRLGFKPSSQGICYGVAAVAMQAFLLGDIAVYSQAMLVLAEYASMAEIASLPAHLYVMLEQLAFFTNAQSGAPLAVLLATVAKAYSHDKEVESVEKVNAVTSVYQRHELELFLSAIATAAQSCNCSKLSFILRDADHAIMMSYDQNNPEQPWLFLDADALPDMKKTASSSELAGYIFEAFTATDTLAISLACFTNQANVETAHQVFNKLNNHKEENGLWQRLHTPTPQRAQAADAKGGSWLMQAILENDVDLAIKLIANGADVNAKIHRGTTSLLYMAADRGCTELVKLLLECGANPNVKNIDNKTALYIAALRGHADIVALLLQHRANPHIVTIAHGESPLYVAAISDHVRVADTLLQYGANPDLGRREGTYSPLGIAACKGHHNMVKCLLDAGASKSIKTEEGQTPEALAQEAGFSKINKLIKRHKRLPRIQQLRLFGKSVLSRPNPVSVPEYQTLGSGLKN